MLITGIYEGNAIEILPTCPSESVDIVITSPRYNFGKNYPGVSDKTSMTDYFSEMFELGRGLYQVVKHDGVFFLNVGCRSGDPLHDVNVVRCFMDAGWVLQERVIWQKADELGNGHFTPINSKKYLNNLWESIFILSKTGNFELDRLAIGVPFKDQTNIKRWKHGKTVHCRGDVWYIPYKTIQSRAKERYGHEATFPRDLVKRCLQLSEKGRKNLSVLDPCCGTGTVPCVAYELGHVGTGIDLSAEMVIGAKNNLELTLERLKISSTAAE